MIWVALLFLGLVPVQNVWVGNQTRAGQSFLEPIVVPKANISEMYTGFVNHTAEFLFDFEYTEAQVILYFGIYGWRVCSVHFACGPI